MTYTPLTATTPPPRNPGEAVKPPQFVPAELCANTALVSVPEPDKAMPPLSCVALFPENTTLLSLVEFSGIPLPKPAPPAHCHR